MRSNPLSAEGAGGPAPFSTDDLVARRGRLIGLHEPVLTLPPSGDHVIDPGVPMATGLRDAAVLIPVVARGTEAGVILTQRTDHLPAHAGQIAFPGGKVDAGDVDPAATALREAEEEIGLSRFLVTPLGYGDPTSPPAATVSCRWWRSSPAIRCWRPTRRRSPTSSRCRCPS